MNISDENQIKPIIENYIERNFGGISYEIDIDFNSRCNDIRNEMESLKEILKGKISITKKKDDKKETDKGEKVSSVYLFKKIFNEACALENYQKEKIKGIIYQIDDNNLDKYNLNKCINDNINDNNSRYLLLEIRSNLAPLIKSISFLS